MLEHYYVRPSIIDKIRGSWLGSQIENYAGWMEANGYSSRTVFRRLPIAEPRMDQGLKDHRYKAT
jgi:integrase/recombinase XerD